MNSVVRPFCLVENVYKKFKRKLDNQTNNSGAVKYKNIMNYQ